ncbi:Hypothetical predicted protein [Mytilus galloprovincialis]|uniref:Novel STAND NTPase 3 domain-containing protein n=1 Tax=Mytilus galloprovincialis TaxID=29158 RepID=A0A8B6E951_MYTGA|nr:Hypothetical predicted protein [Mytilus galloprovincialis]
MASLSVEEENYIRMSLLLTGISKGAARKLFDSEFSPRYLSASLRKEYNKLLFLKTKHLINRSQWNLLFPRYPPRFKETLKAWKENDDKMFIKTRAAKLVFKCIKEHNCVTITASSGVGKTAILRHVALQMAEEEFNVLLVTEPCDIVRFYNPREKILFVIDDFCGNFSVKQRDVKRWEPVMEDIKKLLGNKRTRIIAACHLHVYKDKQFESLSVFKSCECNILSENICLLKTEKQSIADLYLNTKAPEITGYSDLYDCFPLLCKLYHDSPRPNVKDFFQNPFTVYEAEIDQLLKKGHYTKYCALALCVIFNNKLNDEILVDEVNVETRIIIEDTCEACRLDRTTPRLLLQHELNSLKDTFIRKVGNMYKIIHDKIFDFLAYFFGQKIIQCLIKNADSSLIQERFLLACTDEMDQFLTIIPPTYHQMYIQRMIDDWSKGKVQDVFSNINMKMQQFRRHFMLHLDTLDITHQRQLAHICDQPKLKTNILHDDGYDVLLKCCIMGDISLVLWCCDLGVDVNNYIYFDESPLMKACEHGHTEIVKILFERGANFNRCDDESASPVMKACEHGHTEIVKILIERGADFNRCSYDNQSPLTKACEHSYTEIVKILLERGADFNICDYDSQSPLMKACEHGHTEIVKILLERGADFNRCSYDNQSP